MQFSVEVNGKPLWQRIIEGDGYNGQSVTATGRQWKDGDYFANAPKYKHSGRILEAIAAGKLTLYNSNGNQRYRVGQIRTLIPGRGKPEVWYRRSSDGKFTYSQQGEEYNLWVLEYINRKGNDLKDWLTVRGFRPARIRITDLSKLDVREMTDAQAQRTGFPNAVDYLAWWTGQYIKSHNKWNLADWAYHKQHPELWLADGNYQFAMLYIGFELAEA